MSRNVIITVVVVIVVILGGWYLLRPKQETVVPTPSTVESTPAPVESASPASATEGAMMKGETVVKITASGFSAKAVTIKAGETVTWENDDTAAHAVNSAPHPTHTAYPPLNLGNVASGAKVSLKFPTAGTYKYHDHLNPTLFGSVTVK